MSTPDLYVRNSATGQYIHANDEKLTSGTTQNGTWGSTFKIPQGSAPGLWEIGAFTLGDAIGNTNFSPNSLGTFKVN
ncbi:hypothetical protein AB0271_11345 [Kocuria palustris]|uniref:hypothetical protein n=1 Tax=Kocuria palustris TaxID=71999 RepID=UPI00344D5476